MLCGEDAMSALVMSMGTAAFAASITINPADGAENDENTAAETYYAYKIFDATFADGTEHSTTDDNIEETKTDEDVGFSYTIQHDSDWYSVIASLTDYFTLTDKGEYSLVQLKDGVAASAATAQAIAAALKPYTDEVTGGTIHRDYELTLEEAKTVDDGYYLITSSLGDKLVIATTDMVITEKNDYPSVEKEIATTDANSQIGKDVTFTVTVTVPGTANKAIYLTDTLSDGLTFKEISSVKVGSTDVDYTTHLEKDGTETELDASIVTDNDNTFVIMFDSDTVEDNQGNTIVVTYVATVNSAAVVYTAEENEVKLDYSQYSQSDTAETQVVGFEVVKYDGSDSAKAPIAGAVFQLKQGSDVVYLIKVSDTEYRVADATEATAEAIADAKSFNVDDPDVNDGDLVADFITVDDDNIVINGLDADLTYTLTELKAPTGFNKLTEAVSVSLNAENNIVKEIENNKGTQLPSTGGIGTTIFYVVGSILVVAAGVLLITKKRMSREG